MKFEEIQQGAPESQTKEEMIKDGLEIDRANFDPSISPIANIDIDKRRMFSETETAEV